MKPETKDTILQQVRLLKEENASAYGYSLDAIIASARERQEASGRRIIRKEQIIAAQSERPS